MQLGTAPTGRLVLGETMVTQVLTGCDQKAVRVLAGLFSLEPSFQSSMINKLEKAQQVVHVLESSPASINPVAL